MWLPKDERKVLLKYYRCLQNTQEYRRFESLSRRAYISTRNLIDRGLVHEIKEGGRDHTESLTAFLAMESTKLDTFLASWENDIERNDLTLRLSIRGYDLGSKYDHWFSRTGLWFAEYKDHWLWLICAFAGGIFGALIVEWLK